MIRRFTSAEFVPANAGAKAKNPVGSTLFSTPMVASLRHPGHKILRTCCRESARKRLTRGLNQLPYGVGASLAHVVGSGQGGGFEWHAAPSAAPLQRGNTAIELDDHGGITRFTTIYDSYQFSGAQYQALVLLGAEQWPVAHFSKQKLPGLPT